MSVSKAEPEVRGLERSVAFLLEARLRMHSLPGSHLSSCPPKTLEISKVGEDQESPVTAIQSDHRMEWIIIYKQNMYVKKKD